MLRFIGNDVQITPLKKYVEKSLTVPGSKSITNRVLLLSVLNKKRIVIKNVLVSDDTNYMLDSLRKLGFTIHKEYFSRENEFPEIREFLDFIGSGVNDGLLVKLGGERIDDYKEVEIFTGNSGTTMRFLCSFVPLLNGRFLIDGEERMRERPIGDLTNALKQIGVNITDLNGFPPVFVQGEGRVRGGVVEISGKLSSQYISSLMLSAPMYDEGLEIRITDKLVSRPFVDLTSKLLEEFGVHSKNEDYKTIFIPRKELDREKEYFVEPDLTNAFYFLSIPAIVPSKITVYGVGKNTIQGDIEFLDVLKEIGCRVEVGERYISVEGDGKPKGIEIDMNNIPDLVQTLAVIAMFGDRPTVIRNVYNLRVKETDRIKAIFNEITKVGGVVEEYKDGLKIVPQRHYIPSKISTYNDHRMAMGFSLLGLRLEGIVIENYRCTSKTFPSFWNYLEFIYSKHLY
ncbi:MAG: 3-phosphoshikimate 1-carboxyvinyltransferase [Brevinematia bacterium]